LPYSPAEYQMTRKFDLAIAVALIPILGTGLVLMDQLGRFLFYGIPAELLEIDAYKVLVSSLSMIVVGCALLYAGASFYDPAGQKPAVRLVFHLGFAAALTSPFWARDVQFGARVSIPTVAFVLFTGGVFFSTERWLRQHRTLRGRERLSGLGLICCLLTILVFLATLTHGYLGERDRTSFTFVAGSNDAFVGRTGELLILKGYDPRTRCFVRARTKLVTVESALTMEQRSVPQLACD